METQDIVENWRREAIQQGERAVLLRQLRQRFGDKVDTQSEQRIATASIEQLETAVAGGVSAARWRST